MPYAHTGVCAVPVPGGTRVHLTPGRGELTPWPSRPGARRLTLGAFLGAVCTSPLGALFGLALLALLWLSGCA